MEQASHSQKYAAECPRTGIKIYRFISCISYASHQRSQDHPRRVL